MFGVESVNDVAAYCGFIGAILDREVEAAEIRALRPDKLEAAPLFVRQAHRLGLEGVVLAIDNDGAKILHEAHDPGPIPECRHCSLRKVAKIEVVRSWPRPALPPLGFVFGVPVQTIETWLLLARGHPFSGDPHAVGRDSAGRRMLKKWLYDSEEPSSETMQRIATEVTSMVDATALATTSRSFAHFAEQVRAELAPS